MFVVPAKHMLLLPETLDPHVLGIDKRHGWRGYLFL